MKTEENEISSDESIISGNSLDEQRFGNHSCNENKLPLKKRFGGKLPCFKCNWRLQKSFGQDAAKVPQHLKRRT